MYEFNPLHSQIDNLLSTKGNIKCVEAHFGIPHFEDKNNIRYFKELGGGAILDTLRFGMGDATIGNFTWNQIGGSLLALLGLFIFLRNKNLK